jgi:hypothetical protein
MTKSNGSVLVTALVAGNFAAALWHLHILQNVHSTALSSEMATLGPIVGSVSSLVILLVWTRFYKVGAWIAAGLLSIGFAIGSYEHFVSVNPNNLFIMPPGAWTLSFQVSVGLLVVIQLLGIWASIRTMSTRDPI